MENGSSPARARVDALRPPVALCLSGGGARGAAQAGVVVELLRSGLRPDFIVGTSIGAWNGAWLASHPTVEGAEGLARWWADPEVRGIFKGMWLGYAGALAWRRSAAISAERVEHLLARGFGETRFEELGIPLTVGATDLLTADLVYFHRGPVAPAVRASSAIPTVLPPVALRDRLLVDGGVVDNFGVHEAVRRGARTIVLIDASTSEVETPPVGLGEIIDRMTLVSQVHQRRRSLAAAAGAGVPLHLIEVGGLGSTLDFQRAEPAVARGRELARAWLAGMPLPRVESPPEEERVGLMDRWHVVEGRVRERVSALPLWRRVGHAELPEAEEPEVGARDA
ncbi:MAG TPA: patatin-like phospholipase family protein [Candidatus Dormibacteraeota bacterium]|nr:patatin-like phospholipase family protein [Candidatus Dormibacteraeota bacterium]